MDDRFAAANGAAQLPGWLALTGQQVSYQLRLLTRSTRSLLAGVLLPVLVLLMHGTEAGSRSSQFALVGGLAALGVISAAFVTHANSLVIGREAGVLRRWRMTPLPPSCYFTGKIVATVIVADASAILTACVAALTGAPVSAGGVVWMLIPVTGGALAWASLGTAASAFIPTAEAAYPLLTIAYLPIALVSGAFGQTSQPSWLAKAATYLPAGPVIRATAEALRRPFSWPVLSLGQAGVLVAWTAAGLAVALLAFRWGAGSAPQRPGRVAWLRTGLANSG
jgi:ABC-2 type transport system permease protein